MRKKKMIITILLIVLILTVGFMFYFPMKLAITESKLNTSDNYLICEIVKTTGFDWRVDRSSMGYSGLVFLYGEGATYTMN